MRYRRRFGLFPNPYLVPPKSRPDFVKTVKLSVDLDDPSQFSEFSERLLRYAPLLKDLVDYVIFERGGRGCHVLFVLKKPVSLRDNLALRLLLYDDPVHVAYDLYSGLYTPSFPNNVLFTRKPRRGSSYEIVYEVPLDVFLQRIKTLDCS